MGKLQSACLEWRIFGAENDAIASALSVFPHFSSLGVWLPGLKARFNSAAVGHGQDISEGSAHLGATFKISLSSLVTVRATLHSSHA